ncbi:MAG: methyltransferase domain-containing protein [Pelobium sp.]
MKYLNIGCGNFYSKKDIWTNLDFASNDKYVIEHNLLQGVPFDDRSFDFVYHSHVLEHFSKNDGLKLLQECFRVLNSGGILRIAIPDLERIARNYILWLDKGIQNPDDDVVRANYNWMLLEMYDQTVRNTPGGQMAQYLFQDKIINEDFVYERIGYEGKSIRENYLKNLQNKDKLTPQIKKSIRTTIRTIRTIISLRWLISKSESDYNTIGRFRLGGEIHQWMYDRYSLSHLLTKIGFTDIKITDACNSYLADWNDYQLDATQGVTRKPDSLFIEVKKP